MNTKIPGVTERPVLSGRSAHLGEQIRLHGLAYLNENDDDFLLCWAQADAAHPRNWSFWKKTYNALVVISMDLVVTMLSTTGSAAVDHGVAEYSVNRTTCILAFTSIYLFGQAFGGLIFPPVSETYGRKTLYIASMLVFSAACVVVAAVPSIAGVLVGRLVSGFVSAIPSIVTAGTVEDIFDSEARIWMIFTWGCAANLGVVLGPIYGAYISETLGWRWAFYIAAFVTGIQGFLCLSISETRPSLLLQRRLIKFHKATGRTEFKIHNPDIIPSFGEFLKLSVYRPIKLLLTEPIVYMISVMSSIAFGQIYLLSEAIPIIYLQFGFNRQQQSLAFLPIGIGFLLGSITRFYDVRVVRRIQARGKVPTPEDKMHGFAMGAPVLAISLWWFAWAIPPSIKTHWVVSMIPLVGLGLATIEFDCTLDGYLTDSYTIYTASAFASLEILRATISGILPLFTPEMYQALDPNKATSILAAVSTIFCVAPFIFLKYGAGLRQKSKFARYSLTLSKSLESGSSAEAIVAALQHEKQHAVTVGSTNGSTSVSSTPVSSTETELQSG